MTDSTHSEQRTITDESNNFDCQQRLWAHFNEAKTLLDFAKHIPHIQRLKPIILAEQSNITDHFYSVLATSVTAASLLIGRVASLKKTHEAWITSLFRAEYNRDYFASRWRIGRVHVNVHVQPYLVLTVFSLLRQDMTRAILATDKTDLIGVDAINTLLDIELLLILGSYIDEGDMHLASHSGLNPKIINRLKV
ncbi:MAG: protoglobin domain-containing protein [Mariprofundales bacterium]